MKLGYKLSVLGVVVMLLALSAYVVLGVGGGDPGAYVPGGSYLTFEQRLDESGNRVDGVFAFSEDGLYVWIDETEGEFIPNEEVKGEFFHWDRIEGVALLGIDYPFIQKDLNSEGLMKVNVFNGYVWEFFGWAEVYSVQPPTSEIAEIASGNFVALSYPDPVPPSTQPSQVSATATSTFTELTCEDTQQCTEIDQIWNLISPYVNKHQGEVYKPESATSGVWVPFIEPVASGGVSSGGSAGIGSGSAGAAFTVGGKQVSCVANLGDLLKDAFLDTVAWAEGAGPNYNIMFGGTEFTDDSAHPVATRQMPSEGIYSGGRFNLHSTAAGRYQFLYGTYLSLKSSGYFSTGFNQFEQDKAAWYLASEKPGRGLTTQVLDIARGSENFLPVSDLIAKEWASFPYSKNDCNSPNCGNGNSYYGQPVKTNADLLEVFKTCYDYHKNPTAVASGSKILHIGDSHSTGPYGEELVRLFKDGGNLIDHYGQCGAAPQHYLEDADSRPTGLNGNSGWTTNCGSLFISSDGTRQTGNRSTPLVSTLLQDNYDLVVISLGANLRGYRNSNPNAISQISAKLVEKVKEKNIPCYWVGPPKGPGYSSNEDYTKMNTLIPKEFQGRCTYINSEQFTNFNFCGTTPFGCTSNPHFNAHGQSGIDAAKLWANGVYNQIKTSYASIS